MNTRTCSSCTASSAFGRFSVVLYGLDYAAGKYQQNDRFRSIAPAARAYLDRNRIGGLKRTILRLRCQDLKLKRE